MIPHVFSSLVSLLVFITAVQSCLFQIVNNNNSNIKNKKNNYVRSLYKKNSTDPLSSKYNSEMSDPGENCVCGQVASHHGRDKWFVYITIKLPELKQERDCLGTVIAHNLVITSHKCLQMKGRRIRPYEVWQFLPKYRENNVVNISNVVVNPAGSDENFPVLNIIYNQNYSVYGGVDAALANDIALIVVKGDLFKFGTYKDDDEKEYVDYTRLPVCIPEKSDIKDLSEVSVHRFGYNYGFGGEFPDDITIEFRVADHLVVMSGKECDNELDSGHFSTPGSLCVRSRTVLPTQEGSPLLTTNEGGYFIQPGWKDGEELPITPQTAFLLGISTVTGKRHPVKRLHYTYFGNVLQNLDIIEKAAEKYSSKWCTTPKFDNTKKATTPSELAVQEWPWETEKIKPRSETLDCACGLINSDKGSGRVASGVDAIPYEFGWMTRFFFNFHEDDPKLEKHLYQCGGAIINDRTLLTAGHCVIEDGDYGNENGKPHEYIKSKKLYISTHHFNPDDDSKSMPVNAAKIYVHPGYIPSVKNGHNNYDLDKPLKFATAKTKATVGEHDIRPICLPKIDQKIDLVNGTVLTAIGWGTLNPWLGGDKESPKVLQKEEIPVRDLKYCALASDEVVTDTVFCTGNFTPHYGVTQGDSGGPLAYRKKDGKYYQVGAVSFGYDIEDYDKDPDKYEWIDFLVDVQQFIPFIEYHSNLHGAQWCKF